MEDEATQFLHSLETRYGGPVGFKTYSTWYACSDGTVRDYGVFLFVIGSTFHFEDFERKPSLFGFPLKPRKNEPSYVKYEQSFLASEVVSVALVQKQVALDCALGYVKPNQIAPAGSIARLFKPLVSRVVLQDGTTFFFELIDQKKFLLALKEGQDGSVQSV